MFLVSPVIRAQSTLIHSSLGKTIHLRCSATAPFDTSFHWRRIDNKTLSSQSNRFRQQQHVHGELLHTILHIKDLEKTDFGLYACYAGSKGGQAKAVIELKEQHRVIETSTHAWDTELTTTITTTTTMTTAPTVRTQILKRNKSKKRYIYCLIVQLFDDI